jgi:ATP-binding cassette subfamily B protein
MKANEKEMLIGDRKIPPFVLLKRTWKYIKPEMPSFIVALIFLAIYAISNVIFPLFIAEVTRNLQTGNPNLNIIIGLAIGYLGLSIISQFFRYIQSIILQKAGQKIIYRLRMDVFEHIENLSQNQFNEMAVGSLVTRVANYTMNMSDLFTNVLVNILSDILSAAAVYVIMFFISWKLSLILLVSVTLVFIISLVFRKVVTYYFKKERAYISDLNAFLNENLSGMKITQIFNQEKRKEEEFLVKNKNLQKSKYAVTMCFGIYRPLINFINYCSIAIIFLFGIYYLEGPEVVAFYLLLSKFFNPIQELADKLNHIQRALTSSERLFNLLDVKPEVVDDEDAIEIESFKGDIEFKNVWFAYNEDQWILKDVSFKVEAGQTAAFVGATGAGKTTILSLIVRNFQIQKGEILIDGTNINKIKIKSLRKCIGQMLQDVFLFTGNIINNITLNDNSYSLDEVKEACKYVNADKFIEELPEQYETEVIERGENYSQGQRQLLSFARTVLHKPQILILDEATANIDTETEVLIQESLEKMRNIGTMLVVAHRLSTVQKSDKIIVLQNGVLIESGTHQELLKNRGHYYKLYKLQYEGKND